MALPASLNKDGFRLLGGLVVGSTALSFQKVNYGFNLIHAKRTGSSMHKRMALLRIH
jgi:hypothetical protein